MTLNPNSDQFLLALPGFPVGTWALPWGGQSPRVLTQAHKRFIFKTQDVKSVSDFVSPDQIEIWVPKKTAPRDLYLGAPNLEPLPWER